MKSAKCGKRSCRRGGRDDDVSVARADEAQAKSLFKAMSDYLAAQKAISFDMISTLSSSPTSSRK